MMIVGVLEHVSIVQPAAYSKMANSMASSLPHEQARTSDSRLAGGAHVLFGGQ